MVCELRYYFLYQTINQVFLLIRPGPESGNFILDLFWTKRKIKL